MSENILPSAVYLKDYQQPSFWAKSVHLTIELDPDHTLVTSRVLYQKNLGHSDELLLQGKALRLVSIKINDQIQALDTIDFSEEHLLLEKLPERFELEIVTEVTPRNNTALEGIYLSQSNFYTQCEPEGFRRITYFLDRPDVMASYETKLIGPEARVPCLLSNGNLIEKGKLPNGKHFALWQDPFPKPSYLFALVAGDLQRISDKFITASGRTVDIHIYVEKENLHKCSFAMNAIKLSMKWDEEVYGLEYDLDLFMVVAVNDFNMGAMENKGLNIFNSKYVLASPETATDTDFENILGVVGHEYFHNWTGNRVTLRDWFQLSLKEGLTVFRDQEFSASQGSHAVKRIQEVKILREHQFPEDQGPMSHPVRPDHFIEINNFYTTTIYRKGAEVIRMLHTLLGDNAFKSGVKKYLKDFDGQAATIEDFLDTMSSVSGRDLQHFKLWYEQSGTPSLKVSHQFEPSKKEFTLRIQQKTGETSGQKDKRPLVIPIKLALFNREGTSIRASYEGIQADEHTLIMDTEQQTFTLNGVEKEPIPSILRDFSAPVQLETSLSRQDRYALLSFDNDAFNRFEAAQSLAQDVLKMHWTGENEVIDPEYVQAFRRLLGDQRSDPRLIALAMQIPSVDYLLQSTSGINVTQLFESRQWLLKELAGACRGLLLETYERLHGIKPDAMDREAIGRRDLKNACLSLLSSLDTPETVAVARKQFVQANNMTDAVTALSVLASSTHELREASIAEFYAKWRHDPLVLDKWFTAQASSFHPKILEHVQKLLQHPDFDILNPNRVYSIFRQFTRCNPLGYHHASGEGYKIVADYTLLIDQKNSQVAATLAGFLSRYKKFDEHRQNLMRQQLQRIRERKDLSKDVYEVVSKSLATATN